METYFASPCRSDPAGLQHELKIVCDSPVIDGIMSAVGGLVAVLNQHRQILTVNQGLLDALGIDDPEQALGLRPGEAIGCRHADEMDAGCGTSQSCMGCGAAIALVACLGGRRPVERTCALTAVRNGSPSDLYFNVHAAPLEIDGGQFILLFLHDITAQQQRAALERAFFHDINNTIMVLSGASELLRLATPRETKELSRQITRLAHRVSSEVALQRHMSQQGTLDLTLDVERRSVEDIIGEVRGLLTHHPAMRGKALDIDNHAPDVRIRTDHALLYRVLSNMLINAFEATHGYDMVRLKVDANRDRVRFAVWNRTAMVPAVACRVFQRNFSTKSELGRGLGTYSMKLIGEELLGGRVSFQSSREEGTVFLFDLPIGGSGDGV